MMTDINMILSSMDSKHPSKNRLKHWLYVASPKVKSFLSDEKTGKWCIFKPVEEVDDAWERITKLAKAGKILVAKTSTAISSGNSVHPDYVICVYNTDWNDRDDIDRVRECLREAGFTEPLKYKRDLETINRVYGNEKEFMIVE